MTLNYLWINSSAYSTLDLYIFLIVLHNNIGRLFSLSTYLHSLDLLLVFLCFIYFTLFLILFIMYVSLFCTSCRIFSIFHASCLPARSKLTSMYRRTIKHFDLWPLIHRCVPTEVWAEWTEIWTDRQRDGRTDGTAGLT